MPLEDYETLINNLPGIEIKDANKIMRRVRFVKSEAEIEKIRHICQITSQGFIDLGRLFFEWVRVNKKTVDVLSSTFLN